ncbi:hypothetical protein H0H81_000057 [Sphagnurus paluster]|uniref:Cytochrome P450 n=1 Tax=Sphagnurus paluster TaxID=117069 RepID=A0A9P7G3B0_9AGAR|nr:hypothetical protein H0H81_000057 [Sphagnurus paluster]
MSLLNETIAAGWAALQDPSIALPTAGALLAAILLYPALFRSSANGKGVHKLGGLSILTPWPFFYQRYDFLTSGFARTRQKLFSFKVFHHTVFALKGEAARKAFYDSKGLDLEEGYGLLMGSAPILQNIGVYLEPTQDISLFNKYILSLLNKERLTEALPTLFDDIQARMEGWGKEGRMDPFTNVYDLVFQTTIRMATCSELATDMEALSKLKEQYVVLEKNATPIALLLPWLPSIAKRKKLIATKNLYNTMLPYVEKCKGATTPSSDAIDFLLSKGLTTDQVLEFVLNMIFLGLINTGCGVCWTLLFLSFHKEWKHKVFAEVQAIIVKHTTTSGDPLHKRLATVPLSAWEEEMPTLDLVLRETLRMTLSPTALRRNYNDNLEIMGTRIPIGDFVAYSLADSHMNPDIYTNPTQFDPTRFDPGREEDKKETYAYLGWGGGRHPCLGMKFAKLETKIIVALFLAGYEYSVVNEKGEVPEHLPSVDFNDIHQPRPTAGQPCYLKLKRIVD